MEKLALWDCGMEESPRKAAGMDRRRKSDRRNGLDRRQAGERRAFPDLQLPDECRASMCRNCPCTLRSGKDRRDNTERRGTYKPKPSVMFALTDDEIRFLLGTS
ncbi:hypothetical protein SAMN05660653_00649 [Desulfonatronum thiosulfatophilum]|uniref:Uncharacterized protein n=1 Tax=Desulfonatronum thiosulfatophilum TaxID=617002 RepID=A0A1G6AY07_9BACT|nr:hypothetical protein SAMN05660653_00649 [Desulfonatronum thiosulfatophilum]